MLPEEKELWAVTLRHKFGLRLKEFEIPIILQTHVTGWPFLCLFARPR